MDRNTAIKQLDRKRHLLLLQDDIASAEMAKMLAAVLDYIKQKPYGEIDLSDLSEDLKTRVVDMLYGWDVDESYGIKRRYERTPCLDNFVAQHGELPQPPFEITTRNGTSLYVGIDDLLDAKEVAKNESLDHREKIKIFDAKDRWVIDVEGGGFIC